MVDDPIVYVENLMESTKSTRLNKWFWQDYIGYKISIQKAIVFSLIAINSWHFENAISNSNNIYERLQG